MKSTVVDAKLKEISLEAKKYLAKKDANIEVVCSKLQIKIYS